MTMSPPKVDCVRDPAGRWRITLTGEIDAIALPRLHQVAEEITGAEPADVLVELTNVTLLLSVGLGFLAQLRAHATGGGCTVTLHRPSAVALRALQIVGFDRAFPVAVGVVGERMLVRSDEQPAAHPPGSGSPDYPGELQAVQAGVQRWVATRAAAEAAESDLLRLGGRGTGRGGASRALPTYPLSPIQLLGSMAMRTPESLRANVSWRAPSVASEIQARLPSSRQVTCTLRPVGLVFAGVQLSVSCR